jgi:hypothetical protein
MKLSEDQKVIRKIAWSRLAFFKKLLATTPYNLNTIKSQITKYRVMYFNSNLDEKGQVMATKKLDQLLEYYTKQD